MRDWLAELTLLVHCPERPEPFGRALVEAMAVGIPVVVSAEGGPSEVVGDAALVVAPHDDAGLQRATRRLLGDAELRAELSARGRERARAFDEGAYAARVAAAVLGLAP
jgi:glycosyltransferase involved in cell wall biosynthesis